MSEFAKWPTNVAEAAQDCTDKAGGTARMIRATQEIPPITPQIGTLYWAASSVRGSDVSHGCPKTTSDRRIAGMVVTTRSHALAALNSLRRHSLASIRRLPTYEAQFDALLASRRRRLYKREGPGKLYVTTRIPAADIRNYEAGKLTAAALVAKLEFKLGHTKSLARRRRQYRKCDKTQIQTHLWLWSYDVPHRYLAERMIHLRLFGRDAQTLVHPCLGCGVQHREFFCLASVGGLAGLHRIVREVLGLLGQKAVKCILLKPPPELEDIWDLLLYG
ncbi:hypothetical protein B0H13DRAFT_1879858 [Mycena leptocephala]|nr:hypothetical protein B0H13DRAFT_1879858 [Mycena leptocephala]